MPDTVDLAPELMSMQIFDMFTDVFPTQDPNFVYNFMGWRSHIDFNGTWAGFGGMRGAKSVNN